MSKKHITLTLLLAGVATACDSSTPEPTDRLELVHSERSDAVSFFAFEAADESADECAVVVLDAIDSTLVVGPDEVIAVCEGDGSACDVDAEAQACGHAPEVVAEQARSLAAEGTEFRDWCPPSEPICGDGGGYGCLAPACKSACGREFRACDNSCDGDDACEQYCAEEAQYCFASCC
jgi:hypothetical protein